MILKLFLLQDYIPSDEDILHAKVKPAVGVVQTLVPFHLLRLCFVELGSARSERRRWPQVFEAVKVVLFFISSNGFDQTLCEDATTNRLKEAANLFEAAVNNSIILYQRNFPDTPFVVVFTKTDLLREKIRHRNIKDHFPDFAGDPHNLDDVKQFLQAIFQSKCQDSSTVLGYHFIDTTNTADVGAVMDSVLDATLTYNLAAFQLL